MFEEPHPIPFVGETYKGIKEFVKRLNPIPQIPRSIHDVAELQAYANEQLARGAVLVNIGNGGATGILEKGKQGVTYGFGNCYLICLTSPDGKATLSHENIFERSIGTAFDVFGNVRSIWLNTELTQYRLRENFAVYSLQIFSVYGARIPVNIENRSEIITIALLNFANEHSLSLSTEEITWLVSVFEKYLNSVKSKTFYMDELYTGIIREINYLEYDQENTYLDKLQNSVFFKYISNELDQKKYQYYQSNLSSNLELLPADCTLFIGESYVIDYNSRPEPRNYFQNQLSDEEFSYRWIRIFEIMKKSPNMLYTKKFQENIDLAVRSVFEGVLSGSEEEIKDIRDFIKYTLYFGDANVIQTDGYIKTIYEKIKLAVNSLKVSKVLIYPPKKHWYFDEPKKADGSIDIEDLYTNPFRRVEIFKGRAWRLAPGPDGRYRLFAERCFLRGGGKYKPNISGGTNAPIYLEPREIDLTKPITVESITQQLLEFGFIKNSFVPSARTTGPNIY